MRATFFSNTSLGILSMLMAMSCHEAGTPPILAPATVAIAPTSAPELAAKPVATEVTPTLPKPTPRAERDETFHMACVVGHSGGSDIALAIRDDGPTFTIGASDNVNGPFEAIEKNNDRTPSRRVVSGKALADPNLSDTFKAAGVKQSDVATMTVYSVFIHGGWSMGLATFADGNGKHLGRVGWRMRLDIAVPCDQTNAEH